jgi:hypothetical protein
MTMVGRKIMTERRFFPTTASIFVVLFGQFDVACATQDCLDSSVTDEAPQIKSSDFPVAKNMVGTSIQDHRNAVSS